MHSRTLRRPAALLALALALSIAACGGGGDSATGPDDSTPRTDTPSALVGEWIYGVMSPTDFHDAYTGEWLDNAYGTSVLFGFTADGRYTQDILIYSSIGGCRTQIFVHNEGTTTVNGDEIRVYPTQGRIVSKDSCNQQHNYDRPDDLAAKRGDLYTWEFEQSEVDGRTYLIIHIDGNEASRSSFRPVD
jgi:hypothetical protein